MDILLIFILAVALDLALGDPPDVLHPVAWMGKVIAFFERFGLRRGHTYQFFYGLLMTLFTMALFTIPVYLLLGWLKELNTVAYVLVAAVLLKLCFTITGLRRTAQKIKSLVQAKNLEAVRFELRALVSRDTSQLSRPYLIAAAVESVAEGMCDSVVSPLFYFLLFGAPGAVAYRVANTHDSMIGYHGQYEYLGKFAARLDDVLNYIPARLAALALVAGAFFGRFSARHAWSVALAEHRKTASPNAGWTIAAAAGALDVELEKVGHYRLGKMNRPLVPETIDAAVRLDYFALAVWVAFAVGVIYLVHIA